MEMMIVNFTINMLKLPMMINKKSQSRCIKNEQRITGLVQKAFAWSNRGPHTNRIIQTLA